jgi:hypothetical protein
MSALALGVTGGARAQRCGRAGRPWVSVAFAGEAWTPAMRAAVLADLGAGLRLRGIDACALGTEGSEAPLALLELQASSRERVAVSIEVHDALTEKRVARDADLHALSPDARALAIAAAADELLRASWAELALSDAPEPSRPPPPEVEYALQSSLAPSRVGSRDHEIGVRAAIEHFTRGVTLLGGDVVVGLWPAERFSAELSFGLRGGLSVDARAGRVSTHALTGAFDLRASLLPRAGRFGLLAALGVAVSSLAMRGEDAASDAIANHGDAWDVHARARLCASYALWPALALRADAGLGVPLRSVEAREDQHVIAGTDGLELLAGVGAEVRF